MNRQIGVDFGTTTSVVVYRDFDKQNPGNENLIKSDGESYIPTMILTEGSVVNRKGSEVHHEECFGWDAANAFDFHSLLKTDFKMGLISSNAAVRKEAVELTGKFFKHLYECYEAGAVAQKGTQFRQITTVVTYPGKFPHDAQQALCKAAEKAGFPNVMLVDESKAAMTFALTYDTEGTKQFFRKNQGKKLKVMLIDMGAGTTDISVFEYDTGDPGNYNHLCSWPEKGGRNFGGSEIDAILCDFYKKKLGASIVKILGMGNETLGQKLLPNKVKAFKEQTISKILGNHEEVLTVPGDLVSIKYTMPEEPDTDLDRRTFEALLKDYLPQFPKLVTGALNKAGLRASQVDMVLLTGGHSQWYFVKEMLVKAGISSDVIFPFPDPHLVVARGASWYVEPEKRPEPKPEQKPAKAKECTNTGKAGGKSSGVQKGKDSAQKTSGERKPHTPANEHSSRSTPIRWEIPDSLRNLEIGYVIRAEITRQSPYMLRPEKEVEILWSCRSGEVREMHHYRDGKYITKYGGYDEITDHRFHMRQTTEDFRAGDILLKKKLDFKQTISATYDKSAGVIRVRITEAEERPKGIKWDIPQQIRNLDIGYVIRVNGDTVDIVWSCKNGTAKQLHCHRDGKYIFWCEASLEISDHKVSVRQLNDYPLQAGDLMFREKPDSKWKIEATYNKLAATIHVTAKEKAYPLLILRREPRVILGAIRKHYCKIDGTLYEIPQGTVQRVRVSPGEHRIEVGDMTLTGKASDPRATSETYVFDYGKVLTIDTSVNWNEGWSAKWTSVD